MKICVTLNNIRNKKAQLPLLKQEEAGIRVGISRDLATAAEHSARVMQTQYRNWERRDRYAAWGRYKQRYFTIAVGGGNTVKAIYRAWLDGHHSDIDWIAHVRFFLLEDSTGEPGWESAENSLVVNFIAPLARKLINYKGKHAVARSLRLDSPVSEDDVIDSMITTMINPINLGEVRRALDRGEKRGALHLARNEAQRYQQVVSRRLGGSMAFHLVVSGIGKDGTLGAFGPYTPELAIKESSVLVLSQESGALRVALSRGVLTAAEHISLIVSGSLKLKALGRFEMDEVAEFEQTVMETPLRMLRETREIAEKVCIFADEQALHFDETVFEYREQGKVIRNKAETRNGEEVDGIHALLMHGFMGLFSFTNLLIRLPSAWTISAMHRGSQAKHLVNEAVFPHYAKAVRKAILKNWRAGRPTPVASHSIGGVISDHLLLSLLAEYDAPIPPYEELKPENRLLVDALRASGMIYLATWAPSDGLSTGENVKSLVSHYRDNAPLDFSGFERIYDGGKNGPLRLVEDIDLEHGARSMSGLDRFLNRWFARHLIGGINQGIRRLLKSRRVLQRMLNSDSPYILRLVNGRLLRKASFYGLLKEINASMHDPVAYQQRHLKALEILLEYDIPSMTLIHEDDFLVSARRHQQEHNYLLSRRLSKEKVQREQDLDVPVRLVLLKRESDELAMDPLNPHLLIMATSSEGNSMARQVTAAMTRFVNETVYRAIRRGQALPLDSVARWMETHGKNKRRSRQRVQGQSGSAELLQNQKAVCAEMRQQMNGMKT
jgi:6-phosphogluconolactonase/glucosamine-6-phosphate isomerase/deaminase